MYLTPTRMRTIPKILAKQRNETAIASLTMAFLKESQIGWIYEAQTSDYPDGLAYLVIDQLLAKYKPTDTISRVELCQKLNKIKMKNIDNLKKLFKQISAVQILTKPRRDKSMKRT